MSYDIEDAREELRQEQVREYEAYLAKRRRLRIALIAAFLAMPVVAVMAITLLQSKSDLASLREAPILLAVLAALAFGGSSLIYLRPSATRRGSVDSADMRSYVDFRIEDLLGGLKRAPDHDLKETERKQAIEMLRERLQGEALQGIINQIRAEAIQAAHREGLDARFQQTQLRLSQEVQDLARRGNLNLVLGILTTISGLSVLAYAVISSPTMSSIPELLSHFLPRLSLAILIEIFAYFFLRLYKQTLNEIKYFQNELTNVESRASAAFFALDSGDASLLATVVSVLSETERNFVLQKDQTTVDLERDKLSHKTNEQIIRSTTEILRSLGLKV